MICSTAGVRLRGPIRHHGRLTSLDREDRHWDTKVTKHLEVTDSLTVGAQIIDWADHVSLKALVAQQAATIATMQNTISSLQSSTNFYGTVRYLYLLMPPPRSRATPVRPTLASSASGDPSRRRCLGAQKAFVFKMDSWRHPDHSHLLDHQLPGETGFGAAVALSATHLVVGAPSLVNADGAKKVFVFKMDSNGDIPTTATSSITSYTGESYFGYAVALSATHLVVGASANKAFVFKMDSNGDIPTTATSSITSYTSEANFGSAVALSATNLVVGANGAKKAFVFKK